MAKFPSVDDDAGRWSDVERHDENAHVKRNVPGQKRRGHAVAAVVDAAAIEPCDDPTVDRDRRRRGAARKQHDACTMHVRIGWRARVGGDVRARRRRELEDAVPLRFGKHGERELRLSRMIPERNRDRRRPVVHQRNDDAIAVPTRLLDEAARSSVGERGPVALANGASWIDRQP